MLFLQAVEALHSPGNGVHISTYLSCITSLYLDLSLSDHAWQPWHIHHNTFSQGTWYISTRLQYHTLKRCSVGIHWRSLPLIVRYWNISGYNPRIHSCLVWLWSYECPSDTSSLRLLRAHAHCPFRSLLLSTQAPPHQLQLIYFLHSRFFNSLTAIFTWHIHSPVNCTAHTHAVPA